MRTNSIKRIFFASYFLLLQLDRNSNQIEKKSAAMKKEQSKADGSGAVPRMQSYVSIHQSYHRVPCFEIFEGYGKALHLSCNVLHEKQCFGTCRKSRSS